MFSNLGSKLKGMVFEEDPSTPVAAPAQVAVGGGQTPQAAVGVNPEYVAAIKKNTFARNTALTSLLSAADKLSAVIPDQATRLKAAHTMTAEGRTVRQIAEAVDIHLTDVDGEVLRFKTVVDGQIKSVVGALQAHIDRLTAQEAQAQSDIENAKAQIDALTKEIVQLSTERASSLQQLQTKRDELDQALVQFNVAANSVKAELSAHKQAILSSLS